MSGCEAEEGEGLDGRPAGSLRKRAWRRSLGTTRNEGEKRCPKTRDTEGQARGLPQWVRPSSPVAHGALGGARTVGALCFLWETSL